MRGSARSLRRHHRDRLIAKWRRIGRQWGLKFEKWIRCQVSVHGRGCACWMCCREKATGERPIQERRAFQEAS